MDRLDQVTADGYLDKYEAAAEEDPMGALALLTGWLRTDWRPLFAELRARRPVLVTPGFVIVTRFAEVAEVLSRGEVFTVAGYAPRLEAAVGGPVMLTRDGTPMNWREKGLMQVMLPPGDVPRVRELAGRAADEALDAAWPSGRIEAVGGLFRRVCMAVCAEYFGFPGPDPGTLSRWSRAVMTDVTANLGGDPAIHTASVDAGTEMMGYLRGLLAERRAAISAGAVPPPQDVLARLLRTELPAELALDDQRILINVAGLLLGFAENASGSMVHVVQHVLRNPEIQRSVVRAAAGPGPEEFDRHVWEALRFDPFLKMIVRTCERDHVLAAGTPHETVVPAGSPVLAAVASAMFDETAVQDPGAFRLDRPAYIGLHFGHGPHACVGAYPGAAVVCETLRRLFRRPGVRLLPPPDGTVQRDRGVFPDRFLLGLDEKGM
ncbi:cytochrome P450 [Actinomadura rubrisoli]|uniref:Cytochrome P450 n=1 Tax=Actinomadura rubrisoli TaxID=2530368 RepID=A0A4R5BAZ6_9ACTN|nr:cytochrome P450 [Actinomadura rubrisoli]TDD82675.1 cytochrome P450 [Actinomadura rubrisoli]